jgi:carbonic anhydrase/acetyltransferase-like protein (isoleucine patch superfamily)
MAIYALGDRVPTIDPSAFVHPDATVIGNVTIGPEAGVWPQAVVRGDYGYIVIGARTSIQDGSIIHATAELPTLIGDDCVIGHLVHMECCTIQDGALVGTGSIVLHECVVESGAWVGAGAVVPNRMRVPSGSMALGVPAKLREGVNVDEIRRTVEMYVQNAKRYQAELRRID